MTRKNLVGLSWVRGEWGILRVNLHWMHDSVLTVGLDLATGFSIRCAITGDVESACALTAGLIPLTARAREHFAPAVKGVDEEAVKAFLRTQWATCAYWLGYESAAHINAVAARDAFARIPGKRLAGISQWPERYEWVARALGLAIFIRADGSLDASGVAAPHVRLALLRERQERLSDLFDVVFLHVAALPSSQEESSLVDECKATFPHLSHLIASECQKLARLPA